MANTKDFPAPPNWPTFGLLPVEWKFFEERGLDMRQFYLRGQIPAQGPNGDALGGGCPEE